MRKIQEQCLRMGEGDEGWDSRTEDDKVGGERW